MGKIDTRMQGSKHAKGGKGLFGLYTSNKYSYWANITDKFVGVSALSPYIKQETLATNLENLVGKGIAYNVEGRAYLATIAEKIATTFDVADGTLLRLVRIQQQDSSAGRLGMESMINAFLNNMYETSEYLSDVADTVRGSMEEVEALMGAADAVALEYQVQKWMGSLYSVGMSKGAVSSIAQAFGQLAAGDISGLTNGGAGNLMIMAANQAGISIADILAKGLDDSGTNQLMAAMVDYLQQIAASSNESRVVQQQIAKIYGLTASDLKAATNLNGSMNTIGSSSLSYAGAIGRLQSMAGSIWQRTSMGEGFANVWDNLKYTMAAGIAKDPIMYGIYKVAGLLDTVAGGINIPAIHVFGNSVDLETTVADLMRVLAFSGGILANLGSIITNAEAGAGFNMVGALNRLGLTSNLESISRGNGYTAITAGENVSESGTIGNASGTDVEGKTMADAADTKKSEMAKAREEEETDIMLKDLNNSVMLIYNLFQQVINGSESIHVTSSSGTWGHYGLTD